MKYYFSLFIFLSFQISLQSQSSAEVALPNIVPNPGFESYSATPIGWFYKGQHFTNVMRFWSSPTAASPDVFGPKVRVPIHWAEKGFGKLKAHKGESMVGLTLFGCDDGKPHCREYLQIQLKEPLVTGQNYYLEFWTNRLPRSLEIDNLGVAFSKEKINIKNDIPLPLTSVVQANKIIHISKGRWSKISGKFIASEEANYLLLGNFYNDEQTTTAGTHPELLPYAYYYIDDILLRKEEPIISVPLRPDDLSKVELEEGKVILLKDIYFDTDKFELLPRSFVELDKLLNILLENQGMIIEITGHTDSQGEDNYNLYLSRKRAKSVVQYLNDNGIPKWRTRYKGLGSKQPIATNTSSEGRQLNRRVEFLIVKL